MTLVQVGISAVWVFICQSFYRQLFPPRKLLLISGNRPIEDILHKFESRRDKYEVVRCVREELGQKALEQEILERYDALFCGTSTQDCAINCSNSATAEVSESI